MPIPTSTAMKIDRILRRAGIGKRYTGFIIFLVAVHVVGVVVSSRIHKENLILGMITGRKNIVVNAYNELV